MWKHIRNFTILLLIAAIGGFWYISRPDVAQVPMEKLVGPSPLITDPREQMFPTVAVAEIDSWKAGEAPKAAEGLIVERFAEKLDHPRNMVVLPNGDILVAETKAPPGHMGKGLVAWIGRKLMDKAGSTGPSANRITLLRDADGDGKPELRSTFLKGLNSPFGIALVGNTLYVANTDAVLSFPYKEGATSISEPGKKVMSLNAKLPNNHWTRNLAASADGSKLYVAVGSNSNIAENGLEAEKGRARVIELDLKTDEEPCFCQRPAQSRRPCLGCQWRVVDRRQRTRHARFRPRTRLSDQS